MRFVGQSALFYHPACFVLLYEECSDFAGATCCIHEVDSCLKTWAFVVCLLKVCVMSEVTELCRFVVCGCHLVSITDINGESMESL